jgi:hypothetical protein
MGTRGRARPEVSAAGAAPRFDDPSGAPQPGGQEAFAMDTPLPAAPADLPAEGRRAPEATFNSEGAFRPPADYPWTSLAEVELESRLSGLLEPPPAPAW